MAALSDLMTTLVITTALLLVVVMSSTISAAPVRLPAISLDNNAVRMFRDSYSRARIFHGTNTVAKLPPFYPTVTKSDLQQMQQMGYTAVRLGCMWAGIEPVRGLYNITYMRELAKLVELYAEYGMYTLLDSHQDVWSPKFCGEGSPDWAAIPSPNAKPFPEPMARNATPIDPNTGYPIICPLKFWAENYFTDAASTAFQNLYDNYDNLQVSFADHWQFIAEYFRASSNVIGYELMNEPWMGDIYGQPELLVPDVAERKNLQPMYQRLNTAIRSVDQHHLVFFEPVTWDYWPVGFTEPPGGATYANRSVLSYHVYCLGFDDDGNMTPLDWKACNFTAFEMMDFRYRDQKRLSVGGFMTEWGDIHQDNLDSLDMLVYVSDKADKQLQSWCYWAATDVANTTKEWALARTYAQATAGTPISMAFNNVTSHFEFVFHLDVTIQAPTVIYLNTPVRYANGYTVSVSPANTLQWKPVANQPYLLEFIPTPSAAQRYSAQQQPRVTIEIDAM